MLETCEATIREACEEQGGRLLKFNGESDHLHALVAFPPSVHYLAWST